MDKYGVLKELECSCGYCVIADVNNNIIETIKEETFGPFKLAHKHEWREVTDGGEKSGDVRSEQLSGTS